MRHFVPPHGKRTSTSVVAADADTLGAGGGALAADADKLVIGGNKLAADADKLAAGGATVASAVIGGVSSVGWGAPREHAARQINVKGSAARGIGPSYEVMAASATERMEYAISKPWRQGRSPIHTSVSFFVMGRAFAQ
ncbi:MAG TPA: hypothetical protein PK156_29610 [Polyangium sp.]|nr:hypothetical protein [Polyangium sp.]